MGQSTNGEIFFGVLTEEGTEFPWDEEQYDGELEDWWRQVNGFEPSVHPWDKDGRAVATGSEYEALCETYLDERRAWDAAHPLPVALVNVCSDEYPLWAIAVAGTVRTALRGEPIIIDPDSFRVEPEAMQKLVAFLERIKLQPAEGPAWYLSSYWG